MLDVQHFLQENEYIDFSAPVIQEKAHTLFCNIEEPIEKAKIAFEYVRDEIPHSFDICSNTITAKASDVLLYQTGICHAKANLLAALLRSQGIPTGMCYQHLTLADDDSKGYCLHCFNAIYLNGQWIRVDARGNTNGKNAQFSLSSPKLAFENRKEYDEYFSPGIYSIPHSETMKLLSSAKSLEAVAGGLLDHIAEKPDVLG